MNETAKATDMVEYPMARSGECPFAPPPGLLELHKDDKPIRRVKTWDGNTPGSLPGTLHSVRS
ncbi:hypothetical protein GCM10020255_000120 [Rhodococcus baikonurensis]